MVLNATIPTVPLVLDPITTVVADLMGTLQTIVGGIFGLYVILVILRWVEYKKMVHLLKQIRNEIKHLNQTLTKKKKK